MGGSSAGRGTPSPGIGGILWCPTFPNNPGPSVMAVPDTHGQLQGHLSPATEGPTLYSAPRVLIVVSSQSGGDQSTNFAQDIWANRTRTSQQLSVLECATGCQVGFSIPKTSEAPARSVVGVWHLSGGSPSPDGPAAGAAQLQDIFQ
ncbi:uncharacterized protein LOC143688433 isoform X2 [Tamandua tetradactyla]|uniref:uncharacterized protein LOC143688433 isoform X2 n=1 Tax=Tamandua tetradactyla TaxID=48850 RepID=UPI0040540BAA